jgi:NTP pyrophosphatase (non-canonical NTP hydrolase)
MQNEIDSKTKEILLIAQEECAEVTQAISKVFRFGFNGQYNDVTNKAMLEEELGDLVCMIGLLMNEKIVNEENVENAAKAKLNKLKKWSSIFKDL